MRRYLLRLSLLVLLILTVPLLMAQVPRGLVVQGVTTGGTGITSYTIGDLLYASNSTALSKLADVAAGSYLRSGGSATAPVWSTLTLPNAATTGDLLTATGSNAIGRLADVAAGSYLLSGGVGVAPAWSTLTLPNAATTGDVLYASGTNAVGRLADVAAGSYLLSGGVGVAPAWSTLTLPNAATTGDLFYASGANAMGNLADVAAGSYLRSGGASTAPVWSTTTLPNSATTGDLLYASASNVYTNRAAVATGQVLASAGTGTAPVWSGQPTLTAGGGTQTYHVPGVLYWENTNTGNAADNNYITTSAYSLPAGTAGTNGDQLVIDLDVLFDATASTKVIKCNLGYTSFDTTTGTFTGGQSLVSTSTAAVSLSQFFHVVITRTTSAAGNIRGTFPTSTAASQSGQTFVSGSITWANANNLLCAANSSVATANIVTIKELRITWSPR